MTPSDSGESTERSLNLTTGGITLLGVLASIGVTFGSSISGPWWVKVLCGLGATLTLAAAVKVGSDGGRGPLARLANWMIGSDR